MSNCLGRQFRIFFKLCPRCFIGKVLVTVFCLLIVFQLNFNGAAAEWVSNGVAGVFATMQAQGVEISPGAVNFIAANEPGKEFNLMPNMLGGLFMVTVLGMQMFSIWMKK